MEEDWDLQAVVRGRSTTAAIAKVPCGQVFSTLHQNHRFCSTGFQDLFEPRKENLDHELQDLYKPFFPKPQLPQTVFAQHSSPISSLSVLGGLQDQSAEQQQNLQVVRQQKQPFSLPNVLKGCMARKQVERNRSDPGMFIVTYTAEHNHPMPTQRNSLAGSARQKPATPSSDEHSKHTSSPVNPNSPGPDKLESSRDDREDLAEGDNDDNEFNVSNMALEDDFFAGLEDFIVGPVTENCLSDHFPASFQFPWLANHSTTTAAGGG